ncbi:hypothetical protein [Amycolatopsis acididurans]|uniref:hypothetical protein n=1 Tax=Amycolatopsis acididurans TaxID=2724524 RepID=UPI0014453F43|nr:hypothetical protein [Amycolatopsis acididurans]
MNLLLFANGLAYIAGGARHRVLAIDTQAVLSTCVMLVLMVTVLVMPAVAVRLHSAAEGHHPLSEQAEIGILVASLIAASAAALVLGTAGPNRHD